jgi:acylphosphatase
MNTSIVRFHATIEGRVQGVGFRYFVVDQASTLNLTGWVRNTYRDEVEVTAEGERQALEKFLQAVRSGPPSAYVTDINFEWLAATGEFKYFQVLPNTW